MALYKGSVKLAGIGTGFNPQNTGTEGQVLTKTCTGYEYQDLPSPGASGDKLIQSYEGCGGCGTVVRPNGATYATVHQYIGGVDAGYGRYCCGHGTSIYMTPTSDAKGGQNFIVCNVNGCLCYCGCSRHDINFFGPETSGSTPGEIEYLLVGGGGSGGGVCRISSTYNFYASGGGGGGQVIEGCRFVGGGVYPVVVGCGGAASNYSNSGGASYVFGIQAIGGGGGAGGSGNAGNTGASGGGGGACYNACYACQYAYCGGGSSVGGYRGGNAIANSSSDVQGGGGGGAGSAGCNAVSGCGGDGGAGVCSCMSGELQWYSGGGGGGSCGKGQNGGGDGNINASGCRGTTCGSGGGGTYSTNEGYSLYGGAGAKGLVIIRYKTNGSHIIGANGGCKYVCGDYTIHCFTSDGYFEVWTK